MIRVGQKGVVASLGAVCEIIERLPGGRLRVTLVDPVGRLPASRELVIRRSDFRSASRRERQYKHVFWRAVAAGKAPREAAGTAAAVANAARAKAAHKGTGPALISEGGSRRQWYPGKKSRR